MNCTAYELIDFELEVEHITDDMPMLEDQFATTPVGAVRTPPAFQQADEEEIHTSFEQSISDRVMVVHKQLLRLSGPIRGTEYVEDTVTKTDGLMKQNDNTTAAKVELRTPAKSGVLRQYMLVVCLCLMLVMAGFDLMGMLLLFMGR